MGSSGFFRHPNGPAIDSLVPLATLDEWGNMRGHRGVAMGRLCLPRARRGPVPPAQAIPPRLRRKCRAAGPHGRRAGPASPGPAGLPLPEMTRFDCFGLILVLILTLSMAAMLLVTSASQTPGLAWFSARQTRAVAKSP